MNLAESARIALDQLHHGDNTVAMIEHDDGSTAFVRRLRASDLPELCELYLRSYGEYPYMPTESDAETDGLYLVIINQSGKLIGAGRAQPWKNNPHVLEFGRLIIDRNERGKRYGALLLVMRGLYAIRVSAHTLFTEAVCTPNVMSQTNLLANGFEFYGIEPHRYPGIARDRLDNQPLSCAFMVRHLQDPGHRTLFLPDAWQRDSLLYSQANPLVPRPVRPSDGQRVSGAWPGVSSPTQYFGLDDQPGAEYIDVPGNWLETRNVLRERHENG